MAFQLKTLLRGTPLVSAYRAHKRARCILGNTGKLRQRAEFLGQFVGPGDLCFDVGANFGQTTVPLARLGARVVALEPLPEAFRVLRLTTRRLGGVEVLPMAAGPEPGTAELFTHCETALSSMSAGWIEAMRAAKAFRRDGWKGSVTVEVVALDSLVERFGAPSFIKLDVEGFELDVLRGLSLLPRTLVFEHSPPTAETTYGCLKRIAAPGTAVRLNYTLANTNRFALASWVDLESFERLLASLDQVVDIVVRRHDSSS